MFVSNGFWLEARMREGIVNVIQRRFSLPASERQFPLQNKLLVGPALVGLLINLIPFIYLYLLCSRLPELEQLCLVVVVVVVE